jgi:aryl-alcohol dehydrogenase-like predicted oxidoreductase
MEYTHLGRSGLEVSRIALGCMSLERQYIPHAMSFSG